MIVTMSNFEKQLLAVYAPTKNKKKDQFPKPIISDATGRTVAGQSAINNVLHGEQDRDHLYQKLIEQYGREDLIPFDIVLLLFPEQT